MHATGRLGSGAHPHRGFETVTIVYSGGATLILLLIIRTVMGLRVDPYVEYWGLDLAHHGETIVEYTKGLPKKLPGTPPEPSAKKKTVKKKK